MMNRPNADKPAKATVTPTITAGAYSARRAAHVHPRQYARSRWHGALGAHCRPG